MASKYRKIDPRTWRDERFVTLGPEEKLVALYCLTAQANRCGIFSFSPAMASEELGLRMEVLRERFRAVIEKLRWKWDKERRVLYIPTWWKYNPPENVNVFKGCLTDLEELPQTLLLQEFYANEKYLSRSLVGTLRERSTQPSPIQEQEQEQEQEQDTESPEPHKAAATGQPARRAAIPVFPVVGGGGSDVTGWFLSEEKLAEYIESFPGVNVVDELKAARQWLLDNPTRQKTRKGMTRFLGGWLSRIQNSGGNHGRGSGQGGGGRSGGGVRPSSRIESPAGKYATVPVIVAGEETPRPIGASSPDHAREAA